MSKNKKNDGRQFQSNNTKGRKSNQNYQVGKGNQKGKCQDPLWYAMDAEAVKQSGTLPFNNVVGTDITTNAKDRVPGFITYRYVPICGSSQGRGTNGKLLTQAADTYYQYVTQGFTGGVDFEAPDLFMTAIAAASLRAFMAEGPRAIGYLGETADLNSYWPEAIIRGLGFDYSSIVNMVDEEGEHYTKADFMADYNIRAKSFNNIVALPKDFFIDNRWTFLAEHVFSDNDDAVYNTMFGFVMDRILKYNGTSMDTGTALEAVRISGNTTTSGDFRQLTIPQYFAIIDECLDALTDDDPREMFGAIRRVYSSDWFVQIPLLKDPDWTTPIMRNDAISTMVHNADMVADVKWCNDDVQSGSPYDRFALIQTSNGKLRSNLYATYGMTSAGRIRVPTLDEEKLIDTFTHDTSPGFVLDITADMISRVVASSDRPDFVFENEPNIDYFPISARAEVLLYPIMWKTDLDTDDLVNTELFTNRTISSSMISSTATLTTDDIMFTHVNSHPFIKYRENDGSSELVGQYTGQGALSMYLGEIDRYTTISSVGLERMHGRSYYTLFALPKNSKSVTR